MRGNKRERAILYLVSSSLSNAAPFLVPSILSCEAEAQLSEETRFHSFLSVSWKRRFRNPANGARPERHRRDEICARGGLTIATKHNQKRTAQRLLPAALHRESRMNVTCMDHPPSLLAHPSQDGLDLRALAKDHEPEPARDDGDRCPGERVDEMLVSELDLGWPADRDTLVAKHIPGQVAIWVEGSQSVLK